MGVVPDSWHQAQFPDRFQSKQGPLTWEWEQRALGKARSTGCCPELPGRGSAYRESNQAGGPSRRGIQGAMQSLSHHPSSSHPEDPPDYIIH